MATRKTRNSSFVASTQWQHASISAIWARYFFAGFRQMLNKNYAYAFVSASGNIAYISHIQYTVVKYGVADFKSMRLQMNHILFLLYLRLQPLNVIWLNKLDAFHWKNQNILMSHLVAFTLQRCGWKIHVKLSRYFVYRARLYRQWAVVREYSEHSKWTVQVQFHEAKQFMTYLSSNSPLCIMVSHANMFNRTRYHNNNIFGLW